MKKKLTSMLHFSIALLILATAFVPQCSYAQIAKSLGIANVFTGNPITVGSALLMGISERWALEKSRKEKWYEHLPSYHRSFIVEGGVGNFIPIRDMFAKYKDTKNQMRDFYDEQSSYYVRVSYAAKPTRVVIGRERDPEEAQAVVKVSLELAQAKLGIKEQKLDKVGLSKNEFDRTAYFESATLQMSGQIRLFGSGNFITAYSFGGGLGAYRFRFRNENTFKTLGRSTLTELRDENNELNYGYNLSHGIDVFLFQRLAVSGTVEYGSISRTPFMWKTIPQVGEALLLSLPFMIMKAISGDEQEAEHSTLRTIAGIGEFAAELFMKYRIGRYGKIFWTEQKYDELSYFQPQVTASILF